MLQPQGNDDTTTQPRAPKVRAPNTFNGSQGSLKAFLMQCEIYFTLREIDFESEADKVLFAAGLMRKMAVDWAEPIVRDYLDHTLDEQQAKTQTMFDDFEAFKQKLVHMFGDPGEERHAATILMGLRQDKTVTAYAARYKQLLVKT